MRTRGVFTFWMPLRVAIDEEQPAMRSLKEVVGGSPLEG
jgi:hypothetical protein